ncbi:hypothetical protein [Phenylobacterium sp.]|uniref:hypothetical protein n=1 Tax=Phenylobacterium sp. TaxID=1871053 RepID=UPI002E309D39|nr:hypothetical protein [Phenylobacterium sp.]HEX4710909.1 hypothetical protein [Phenylobacterium sp.]
MKLSPVPDFSAPRRLAAAAAAVWLIACAAAAVSWPRLVRTVGDTDDALRLTMVRDLVAGRGWFDQRLSRLQPPAGLYMHWSRLVDGAEAALLKLFASVLPADQAEMAMRLTWPVLWVLPLTAAVLLIARRLGGGRAVFLGMVTAALSLHASGEFQPGRVDHHNIQITCCLLALAAATQRPAVIWGALCGLATAAGLAIGLEALPFAALIGAAMGLLWVFGRSPGRVLAAYGAALGLGAVGLGALQTPPDRWLLPACDALAVNLAAGLGVAGAGLCAAAALAERWDRPGRLGVLAVVGALAGAAYVAVEPLCLHGPMAAVDPALKSVWLANVREMTPWLVLLARDPATAINLAAPAVAGLLGWLWLGRRPDLRANPAWRLSGVLLAVSIPMALQASRSIQYSLWFAAPVTAAALVDFADVALAGLMVPAVAVLVAVTQIPGLAAGLAAGRAGHPSAPAGVAQGASTSDRCTDTQAFRPLARLAPGLVLSEIDEGPYVLANTPDAALQAPYHRMGRGIREARAALGASPLEAEGRIRALKVAYVVNCPAHAAQSDRQSLAADSLQRTLDAGRIPAWLEPLSRPGEPLQIFRVR